MHFILEQISYKCMASKIKWSILKASQHKYSEHIYWCASCRVTASFRSLKVDSVFQTGRTRYDSPLEKQNLSSFIFSCYLSSFLLLYMKIQINTRFLWYHVSVFMTHLCFYLCVWWRETIPSLHHLNINLMNAAFNVTAKYNTAHIPPEREPRGCSGGGGEWVEWRKDSKMRRGDREILQG